MSRRCGCGQHFWRSMADSKVRIQCRSRAEALGPLGKADCSGQVTHEQALWLRAVTEEVLWALQQGFCCIEVSARSARAGRKLQLAASLTVYECPLSPQLACGPLTSCLSQVVPTSPVTQHTGMIRNTLPAAGCPHTDVRHRAAALEPPGSCTSHHCSRCHHAGPAEQLQRQQASLVGG